MHHPACGRPESPITELCAIGQDSHSYPCVPMETRTEAVAESARPTAASILPDNGEGSSPSHHHDCEWRRIYPCQCASAGHSRCRCGVLRSVGRSVACQEPWRLRVTSRQPRPARPHAAKTFGRGSRTTDAEASLPDGHWYLDPVGQGFAPAYEPQPLSGETGRDERCRGN